MEDNFHETPQNPENSEIASIRQFVKEQEDLEERLKAPGVNMIPYFELDVQQGTLLTCIYQLCRYLKRFTIFKQLHDFDFNGIGIMLEKERALIKIMYDRKPKIYFIVDEEFDFQQSQMQVRWSMQNWRLQKPAQTLAIMSDDEELGVNVEPQMENSELIITLINQFIRRMYQQENFGIKLKKMETQQWWWLFQ